MQKFKKQIVGLGLTVIAIVTMAIPGVFASDDDIAFSFGIQGSVDNAQDPMNI